MTADRPLRIANIAEIQDPNWIWIRDLMDAPHDVHNWSGFSTHPHAPTHRSGALAGARRFVPSLARWRAARQLAGAHKAQPFNVIVSHRPITTAWTAAALGDAKGHARHLAFSFNFTDLPQGARRKFMTRAFQNVDAVAVFSQAEQSLYADYFDIDPNNILLAPWGVAPPLSSPPPREIEGLYFASLGGEARDYEVLCDAARRCPDEKFVVVARPHNFRDLSPPSNLEVHFDLPFERAWAIIYYAEAALIPLRSRETPCGLVTLVGGMHLGKAQIVTDAAGVGDYVRDGETGLLVPPNDGAAIVRALQRLKSDPSLTTKLGNNAREYADVHCSEAATVRFFESVLND